MSVLKSLESKIAGLVEGTFSRAFRTEVRPVEIARRLSREMEEHRSPSLSKTYVPNEYAVYLSSSDRARFAEMEDTLRTELAGHLLEHARRERFSLLSRPVIEFRTDDRLHLGEFGIQARLVRSEGESAKQADHGHTMVYSTSDRVQESLTESRADRAGRAILQAEGRRLVIAPGGAVVGRSREADVVLSDSNVSRKHAEIRPGAGGQWTVSDLGSTNGVQVNGRRISGATPLKAGDRVVFGTVDAVFEVE
jgi:hypothetical protein